MMCGYRFSEKEFFRVFMAITNITEKYTQAVCWVSLRFFVLRFIMGEERKLNQNHAPIYEALENFRKMRVVPFDVPGH